MPLPRSSGVLLHPTSLPGPHGIGDLGAAAHQFLAFLSAAGQRLWQVLPLGPTGFADSPYQSFSTFAGNPLLIDLAPLVDAGWILPAEIEPLTRLPVARVDYGDVVPAKRAVLESAAARFLAGASADERAALAAFRHAQASWLPDFTLFMALKDAHDGAAWQAWESGLAMRQPAALARAGERLAGSIAQHAVLQLWFFRQWDALKRAAAAHGVRLFGDLPIFVAYDSADVWSHRELFHLDADGRPTVVAGVPPDLFSATGQRWGNPLYRWEVLAEQGFAWWIERLRHTLALVDLVRIDHFIGFARYWEIPVESPTAVTGRWMPAPGAELLEAARTALGALPLVAEDLGALTPAVDALRERFDLPGMKVLQFAFDGDATNPYLPHNYTTNCVAYTGTHDNDTARGWFRSLTATQRAFARRYLGCRRGPIVWPLIRAALASVADTAVVPLQDVLALGSAVRMNYPGKSDGNWSWRFLPDQLSHGHAARLRELAELYGRIPPGGSEIRPYDPPGR